MKGRAKATWLRVHRWVALGVGWLLAAVALMGAILVVAQPIDRAMHPMLFETRTAGPTTAPLEPIRQRLSSEFGRDATLQFRPPREANETLSVSVRAQWSGDVYFDPATGLEQGRRGDDEGFVNVLFKLHSSLLLKDTGKAILAWIALAYLTMLVTGLVLWWPRRWPPSLKIDFTRGTVPALFGLHRTIGAVLGLFIAVSVASGAYMAWRPLNAFVTFVSGGQSDKPPTVPPSASAAIATVDDFVAQARKRFPDAPVGYVNVPGRPDRPVRVRMRLPDDPHPNGLTSVWLDPRDATVLRVDRWNRLDLGARAVAFVYPLHTGVLGGAWLEAVVFVNGIALGTLGFSGLWLWWRRRRKDPVAG